MTVQDLLYTSTIRGAAWKLVQVLNDSYQFSWLGSAEMVTMTPFKDVFRRLLGVQLGIIRDVHNFSEREDSPDEDHRGEDNSPLFVVLEQVADMHEAIRDAYDDDYNIGEI